MIGSDNYKKTVLQTTIVGALCNIFLSFLKIAGGLVGKSSSLLADGVHSFSDLSTDLLIILGVRYWSQPSDEDHPHGHRRIETVVTIGIASVLLIVGATILVDSVKSLAKYESCLRPEKFTVLVAFVSILIKEFMFRFTMKRGKRIRSSALIANAWHQRSDAFSSLPVLIALITAVYWPRFGFVDRLGAVFVAVVIIQLGVKLIYKSFVKLVDSSAGCEDKIRGLASQVKGVLDVHAVRSRFMGSAIAVDLHIEVDPDITVREGHHISEQVKQLILEEGPDVIDVIVYIEPLGDRED